MTVSDMYFGAGGLAFVLILGEIIMPVPAFLTASGFFSIGVFAIVSFVAAFISWRLKL